MTALVVDLGCNNLASLVRAIEEQGSDVLVSSDPVDIRLASRIILPGIGSFATVARAVSSSGWREALREATLARGTPLLGICLGMHLLADHGTEGGDSIGLGLISGEVVRLNETPSCRVPHVGWNDIRIQRRVPLLDGVGTGTDFYFVHSYHFVVDDPAQEIAVTDHGRPFTSVVGSGRIFGTQFHPEKSSRAGATVLRNFLLQEDDQ